MPVRFLPQRLSRSLVVAVAIVFFLFITTARRLQDGSAFAHVFGPVPPPEPTVTPPANPPLRRLPLAPGACDADIEHLRRPELELTNRIRYSKRCVKPLRSSPPDRDAVVRIEDPLVTQTTTVNLTSCDYDDQPIPCAELTLPVGLAYPKQKFGHLAFAVASKYDRIQDSLPAFAHWLADSGATLVGVIVDAEAPDTNFDLVALTAEYAASGVEAKFVAPRLKPASPAPEDQIPVEHHHFMLLEDLMEVVTTNTTWLGILDDDTFFPSLYPLDQALKQFNASKEWWLGNMSEDFAQVRNWGIMAYGGAGSFLSMPLARKLAPFAAQCRRETTVGTGDGMLRDCVYMHSRAHLTLLDGLNQHDLNEDASGFYESGARPLSVHHWKSWYHDPMPAMAAVTRLCGDCFLQRYRFDGDFLLANGYSITQYPGGLDAIDLAWMEGTWPHSEHVFDYSYGWLRPKLARDQKKSWKLADARTISAGRFHQIYVYRDELGPDAVDEVIEFVWDA